MARRRNKGRAELSAEETVTAIKQMMYAAEAHQHAAVWCNNNPEAKLPNIDYFYFMVVSLELVLLSVEQSLRLLLLLHYSIVRSNTNHSPHVLYGAIRSESGGKIGMRQDIVDKMNALAQTEGIALFSEEELLACLKKHSSSYSNFRYFQLGPQARLNPKFEITTRDGQVVHYLARALILLNMEEIEKRGIGIGRSLVRIPESEMTQELKALKEHLKFR